MFLKIYKIINMFAIILKMVTFITFIKFFAEMEKEIDSNESAEIFLLFLKYFFKEMSY